MKGPLAPPNEFEGATQSVSSLHFEPVLLSLVIDRRVKLIYIFPVYSLRRDALGARFVKWKVESWINFSIKALKLSVHIRLRRTRTDRTGRTCSARVSQNSHRLVIFFFVKSTRLLTCKALEAYYDLGKVSTAMRVVDESLRA
jgi:hypothetical protein